VVVVVVLAAGGGAVAIVASKGGAPARSNTTVRTSAGNEAATNATATTSQRPLVSIRAAEAVLQDYAAAYSAESPARLAALLAPMLVRTNGNHPPENRGAALATYEGQFRELKHPIYRLAKISVTPEPGAALASARYTITSQNGTVQSPITFHLVLAGGRLEIDKIAIPPGP